MNRSAPRPAPAGRPSGRVRGTGGRRGRRRRRPRGRRGEGGWDTGLLSDDEAGFLIDGSGRIVAATPAASDALASAGVGSGVRGRGRRFIDLVPRGRRQAVLAAFTLQLATDRGLAGVRAPLSDLGVRGPLGSMALGLRRRRTASGRWLLVATLDPP